MKRINKLDASVIHRIAAGEVIQRPSNAIKEMIENSVDAQATSIQIIIQDGGLKKIIIQDNGSGIDKEDLPLLCERYATSKLKSFEDLSDMKTFGFRGEALASISHIARVSVVSKTKDSACAFKADYLNGSLVTEVSPTAGNQGTAITVSDLFYNCPTRQKGVSNASEEFSLILRVVQRYAIELAGRVGFSLRKAGVGNVSEIQTSASLCPAPQDVIKSIYGGPVSKGVATLERVTNERLDVTLSGCVSVPTYHQKSITFILFINGRLVESNEIKRTINSLYSQLLPKGCSPFVYLSITMPFHNVDVNVHPTKNEVFFLHEVEILGFIDESIRNAIKTTALSLESIPRVHVMTQTGLVSSHPSETTSLSLSSQAHQGSMENPTQKKLYPFQLVHSDPKTRTLDSFIARPAKITKTEASDDSVETIPIDIDASQETTDPKTPAPQRLQSVPVEKTVKYVNPIISPKKDRSKPSTATNDVEDPRDLTSVSDLIDHIKLNRHDRLTEMIKSSVIVGVFNEELMLIQYQSQLLMIKYWEFAADLLYQKCLLGFGFHDCWKLHTPLDLTDLGDESVSMLENYSEMLLEYFATQIFDGKLLGLPALIEGLHDPSPEITKSFIQSLIKDIDWNDETECFKGISQLLSQTYIQIIREQSHQEEYLRHYLYPALKGNDLSRFGHIIGYGQQLVRSGAITEIARTHELYKIFERC